MKKPLTSGAIFVAACLIAASLQPCLSQAVAYVYVASASEISGYSAAADGRLTAIPNMPVAARVSHLSTTSKTVFGPGTDNKNIYSFNIGSNGALTAGPVTNVQQYNTNGCPGTLGPTQVDFRGLYLYSLVIGIDCGSGIGTHVFDIGSGGSLNHYNAWYTQIPHSGPPTPIRLLGTGNFAFLTGCSHNGTQYTPTTLIYNTVAPFPGGLYPFGTYTQAPEPSDPEDFFCPSRLAPDPSNHLAFAFRKFYPSIGKLSTPYFLASYTVDTQGRLSTQSNYINMPAASIGTLSDMSISPGGNLLVVTGSYGFELFRFNGGSPITKITHLMASDPVVKSGWDKAGHLFVLTNSSLFVYNATTSGVQLAPGAPYPVSGDKPYSMIVRSPTN